jgi:hypothetical protein
MDVRTDHRRCGVQRLAAVLSRRNNLGLFDKYGQKVSIAADCRKEGR